MGIFTAKDICKLVYAEPAFSAQLKQFGRAQTSWEAAPPLPTSLDPLHPSFRGQAIIERVAGLVDPEENPLHKTRAFLRALLSMTPTE